MTKQNTVGLKVFFVSVSKFIWCYPCQHNMPGWPTAHTQLHLMILLHLYEPQKIELPKTHILFHQWPQYTVSMMAFDTEEGEVFYKASHFFFVFIIIVSASVLFFHQLLCELCHWRQHEDNKTVIHLLYTERRTLSNKIMLLDLAAFCFLSARLTVVCWIGDSWELRTILVLWRPYNSNLPI